MVKAVVLYPDERVEDVTIEGDDTLQQLQELVGGTIQGLTIDDEMFAYINDEGKMLELEINARATGLCAVAWPHQGQHALPSRLPGPEGQ